MNYKKKKKEKSIFHSIFTAMLIVLGIEIILLLGTLYFGNVGTQLNQNAVDILKKQVENRQNYLERTLTDNQSLSSVASTINNVVEAKVDENGTDITKLDQDTDTCNDILEEISSTLISTMRHRSVTGIFVILNSQDLDEREEGSFLPGIYIRDLDPETTPSERNYDLLLERSPIQLVKSLGISTDKAWTPGIKYRKNTDNGILYPPYQAAYEDHAQLNAEDYGRWTTEPYTLVGDDRPAIAYSMPLILQDGTVYGVIGIEMMTSYLETIVPYEELQNNGTGTYFLAETRDSLSDEKITAQTVEASSKEKEVMKIAGEKISMKRLSKGVYETELNGSKYYAAVCSMDVYSKNAPFSDEQWILIGTVQKSNLFAFSDHVLFLLKMTVFLTLFVGILSSFFISRRLTKPVSRLSDEVATAQIARNMIPHLSKTGIRELDQFAEAITQLSRDVLNSSTKFLRIMEMASVELGGYELQLDTGSVYYTENFFKMLGMEREPEEVYTIEEFNEIVQEFSQKNFYKAESEDTVIYCIRHRKSDIRYIRMEVKNENHVQIGLVEDVTVSMMERMRIEHERDYDALTGLYNRRAFKRQSEAVFSNKDQIGHAALVMLDLDNLKYTNDTFGHDWGDEYIRQAGVCLEEGTPRGTLCAHISGDEFNLLLYGYESQQEIRDVLSHLRKVIDSKIICLPNGKELYISISGGISWYPEDSTSLGEMRKHADFAMYQIKKSGKGRIGEFVPEAYEKEFRDSQIRREFHRFVDEELVMYYFQPLVCARTGKILAYEALMRADLPMLKRPDVVMNIAREEGALADIERITMFHACRRFCELKDQKLIRGDELLFVNSIASQHMTPEDEQKFAAMFGDIQKQLVIEITEEESLNYKALEIKRNAPGFNGTFALDDYGSGYSNEKSLLDLSPGYIKVDLSIIRDIDTNADKQQIVENIVAYAHRRGMKIVAEGLETPEEIRAVLALEVDLLQGFYLGRPEPVPKEINPEALKVIADFYCK